MAMNTLNQPGSVIAVAMFSQSAKQARYAGVAG